ncbi:hypothetical protein E3Q22_01731 [Wallemia mellicola]|uniref:GATA-type domain-containing protein n=1 Tax=Wallemia mellicola TaxID=1708541 RepID=A0A4T0MCD2_9BASI|nr:hypothetical protein E3Q22_01731 [Wallemia mellicola]
MNDNSTLSRNEFDSELPPLGATRCYWVLLDRSFNFVYLDPVLSSHMKYQANLLIGTSFYNYLHPAETAQAKEDISSIIESEDIHGSIIRVRFVRLPYIRVQLGSTSPVPSHVSAMCADPSDSTYLPIDIVISSIHAGLYLCFFHAVIDKNPLLNNDQGTVWTNWCHTPVFNENHVEILKQSVLNWSRNHPPPLQKFMIPTRIFQILRQTTQENTKLGLNQIIYSWPPSTGSTGEGPYEESSFASLMSEISINPHTANQLSGAGTSCTRRFKAKHQTRCNDNLYAVQSMFVPYGEIIFACFMIEYEYPIQSSRPLYPTASASADNSQETTTLFDSTYDDNSIGLSQRYYQQSSPLMQNEWSGYLTAPATVTTQVPVKDEFAQTHQQLPPASSQVQVKDEFAQQLPEAPGVTLEDDFVGAPLVASSQKDEKQLSNKKIKTNSDNLACSSCGTDKSPEWRRGPSGKKDLCNACGLRYARAMSKSDSSSKRRKSDTKNPPKKKKPSTSPNPPPNNNLVTENSLGYPLSLTPSTLPQQNYVPAKHSDIPFNFDGYFAKPPQFKTSPVLGSGYEDSVRLYNQPQHNPLTHQLPPQQRHLNYIGDSIYSSHSTSNNADQFQFHNNNVNNSSNVNQSTTTFIP